MVTLFLALIYTQLRRKLRFDHVLHSKTAQKAGHLAFLFFEGMEAHLIFTLAAPHLFGATEVGASIGTMIGIGGTDDRSGGGRRHVGGPDPGIPDRRVGGDRGAGLARSLVRERGNGRMSGVVKVDWWVTARATAFALGFRAAGLVGALVVALLQLVAGED
jgi:hypothetical protein